MKQEIKQKLLELADENYKEFHSGLCPGTENIIGVRVPVLRNYAKELAKQQKIEKLLPQIDDQYYEEIMLQGMLIGIEKEEFKKWETLKENSNIPEGTRVIEKGEPLFVRLDMEKEVEAIKEEMKK